MTHLGQRATAVISLLKGDCLKDGRHDGRIERYSSKWLFSTTNGCCFTAFFSNIGSRDAVRGNSYSATYLKTSKEVHDLYDLTSWPTKRRKGCIAQKKGVTAKLCVCPLAAKLAFPFLYRGLMHCQKPAISLLVLGSHKVGYRPYQIWMLVHLSGRWREASGQDAFIHILHSKVPSSQGVSMMLAGQRLRHSRKVVTSFAIPSCQSL